MVMHRTVGALAVGLLVAFGTGWLLSGQTGDTGVITGVVTSEQGPEEGVWVLAETRDLPTVFRKTVVTGDGGRFLLPQLPNASYEVWVRGYGLVDSARVAASVGQDLALTATIAPTPQEAAKIYPGPYWFSLLEIPAASEFPGTGDAGNGLDEDHATVEEFNHSLNECVHCHVLGTEFTRTIPPTDMEGNPYASTVDAWDQRVRMGQRTGMNNTMTGLGRQRALEMFADWTDRIAAGEVPPAPPRPQGAERNVVITQWEWGTTMTKIHDITATDKRDPTVAPPQRRLRHRHRAGLLEHSGSGHALDERVADSHAGGSWEHAGQLQPVGLHLSDGYSQPLQPDQHPQPNEGRRRPRLVHRAPPPPHHSAGGGVSRRITDSRSGSRWSVRAAT